MREGREKREGESADKGLFCLAVAPNNEDCKANQINPEWRDYCSHLLIPLNKCRYAFAPPLRPPPNLLLQAFRNETG